MNKYSDLKIAWFPEKLHALRARATSAPLYVRIKPTNKCVHACPWCVYKPDVSGMHGRICYNDEMPSDRFVALIRELLWSGVKAITFSGGGEPLYHPAIVEAANLAIEKGLHCSLITNGQLLRGERAQAFYQAHWVRVSMDYFDEDTFVRHRRRDAEMFYDVISNIRLFALHKQRSSLDVNFVVHDDTWQEIDTVVKLLADIGVERVRFSPEWKAGGGLPDYFDDVVKRIEAIQAADCGIDVQHSFRRNVFSQSPETARCYYCEIVPAIGADLNVYPCHNAAYTDNIIGSVAAKSFGEMWISEETRKWFDSFYPREKCKYQCANRNKNLRVEELLDCHGDCFV